MPQPLISRARPDDAARLAQLGEATFRETFLAGFAIPYPADDLTAFIASAYSVAGFEAMIADPAYAVWLADIDGRAVAYSVVGPCSLPHPDANANQGELKRLYVARGHQGLGLGRELFAIASDWLENRGAPVWIGVWSGNVKALRFYTHAGFVKVGAYDFLVGSWRDQDVILRRN